MQPSDEEKEADPKLTRRSPFVPTKKLCPRCLGPLLPWSELGGWLVPQDYYCARCGYRGTVFIEEKLKMPWEEKEG